ncbi:Argonaute complex, subunit Arb1 [Bombardia bombarda]|uniref:Argonaute complex, subunit Arb1 n=1 Tax=Bombardia bombarda TaxID=252184 RepID=A0AA39XN26_9PEZI|nr:Argonaute complex, subunit Arb1 [Bombardia bombarda]
MSSPPDSAPAGELPNDTVTNDDQSQLAVSTTVGLGLDPAAEKKKKKKSGKSKGAKKRGTGFEEFFCDPPMTPAEHEEEKSVLYPPERPFVDRIEECIQRFRARRRMDSTRNNIFTRYLLLGGIDSTVRQFQSTRNLDAEDFEGTTKDVARDMVSDDVIQRGPDANNDARFYNPSSPEHWDVDFAGVVAGFLSDDLVKLAGGDMADYSIGVEVVSNFLKYVDRHDVCSEYAEDLRKAHKICEQALEEIPAISQIISLLPGSFNKAARTLFCTQVNEDGFYDFYDEIDKQTAQTIFGITSAIDPKYSEGVTGSDLASVKTAEQTFEICKISLPDEEYRAKYKSINRYLDGNLTIEACGSLTVFPTTIRDGWDNNHVLQDEAAKEEETFIMEESILRHLKVGMKVTMTVCMLKIGLKFIKDFKNVRPTFYTFLPQTLMLRYKEPVLNHRPGPNVRNLDADDVLNSIPIGEEDE